MCVRGSHSSVRNAIHAVGLLRSEDVGCPGLLCWLDRGTSRRSTSAATMDKMASIYHPTPATIHTTPEVILHRVTMSTSWQEIAAKKQAQREALIPPKWRLDASKYQSRSNLLNVPVECGILSGRQVDITSNYDAVELLAQMRDGSFSVEEVVTAFCARAAIAQQLVGSHLLWAPASG